MCIYIYIEREREREGESRKTVETPKKLIQCAFLEGVILP